MKWALFGVSSVVYVVVNMVENLIHYNIGKHTGRRFHLTSPTRKDLVMMVAVMLLAAAAQGLLVARFA